MSVVSNKFHKPLPPRGSVYTLAHSTTAAVYKTPTSWFGHLVTFVSDTDTLAVRFGNAGVTVGVGKVAAANATTGVLAPHCASGFVIPAGSSATFYVSDNDTHFAVDSIVGTGYWSAYRSSGESSPLGEPLPVKINQPSLRLVFEDYSKITLASTDVASVLSSDAGNFNFAEATNRPAYIAGTASQSTKPGAGFTAGNSDVLQCSRSDLAAVFGGTSAFTLFIAAYRGATGAAHTLFSAGTTGTNNGRFDVTLDASDDVVITRVDSAGSSSTSTYATTMSAAVALLTYAYDGAGGNALYVNRTSQSLTGSATGGLGTLSTVTVGARGYNTSTVNQFLTGEIYEVLAWNRVLSSIELAELHAWADRRYAK